MSIRFRILAMTALVLLGLDGLILATFLFASEAALDRASYTASTETHDTIIRSFREKQDDLLEEAEMQAAFLVRVTGSGGRLETVAQELPTKSDTSWFCVHSLNGGTISSGKVCPLLGVIGTDRAFKTALTNKSWKGIIAHGNSVHLVGLAPVYIGGKVVAIVVAGRTIDRNLLNSIPIHTTDVIVTLDGKTPICNLGTVPTIKSSGGRASAVIDGVDYIASKQDLAHFDGHRLDVTSLVPAIDITEPLSPFVTALICITSIGLLASFAVAYFTERTVTRPILRLSAAAESVVAGEWPAPSETLRADEIGVLERAFDQMTATLKGNQERLLALVDCDPLTELLNYRSFRDKLELALVRGLDEPADLQVYLIDLDHFNEYNKVHGTAKGDALLCQISQLLLEISGQDALVSRYNGNQFAIMTSHKDLKTFGQMLLNTIFERLGITVSVGAAEWSEAVHQGDLMLLAVEIAVGQSKAAGRNRVRVFEKFNEDADNLTKFLQQSSVAAVQALAEAVDAKDEYTRGHSRRVAEYAKELATCAGLDEGFIDLVYVAGQLHDVGKIGVPDEVLKKTGKLDEAEYAMIKTHPALGEKIVGKIPQLKDTLPGVRWHHERYDGRGYPDGLVGESIPIIARVLAIADTFDAMTSDRTYRKGMDVQTALDEIERNAGTQFDPSLAKLFVGLWRGRTQEDRAA